MKILGYKSFNRDLTNHYGKQFSVGKIYTVSGNIKFGNSGNGFHLCKNIEDTLRYFDAMNEEISICRVIGSGEIQEAWDDYYGYYNMYAVSRLEILKELTHEEIINIGLMLSGERAQRFVSGYRLSKEEITLFKKVYEKECDVIKAIEYYQENKLDTYVKKKVIHNG